MVAFSAACAALDEARGAVRVEDVYDTDVDDLWSALAEPERLARWLADVSGDLRVGGTIQAAFTSSWTGPGRIEVCDPPNRLLLTMAPGTEDEVRHRSGPGGRRPPHPSRHRGPGPAACRPAAARRRVAGTCSRTWPAICAGMPRTGGLAGINSPRAIWPYRSPDGAGRHQAALMIATAFPCCPELSVTVTVTV